MKKGIRTQKGFTLVELLVVLVVIGIIIAIALPNTLKAIESANVRETASTLRSIDTAIKLCYSEKKVWTSCNTIALLTASSATTSAYLENIPAKDAFGVSYGIIPDPQGMGYVSDKGAHFPNWPSLATHN